MSPQSYLSWLPALAAGVATLSSFLAPESFFAENLVMVDHDDSVHRLEPGQLVVIKAVLCASFAAAAVFLALVRNRLAVLAEDAVRFSADFERPPRSLWVILAAGLGARAALLNYPISFDEADTFVNFATRPFFSLFTDYTAPNNHILHTVTVRISHLLFGDSLLAIRLPALIAGTLAIPLAYFASVRLVGSRTALLAAALAAGHPALIHYGAAARGYSALVASMLVALAAATTMRERRSAFAIALFIVAGWLGMLTVPVMLHPLAGISIWALWTCAQRPRLLREIIVAALLIGSLTAVSYAPAAARTGLDKLVANRYVRPITFEAALVKAPMEAAEFLEAWTSHILWPIALALAAAAVIGLRNREARSLVGSVFVASVGLMLLQRNIPFARVFVFTAPVACLLVAVGLSNVRRISAWWLAIALTALHVAGYWWFPTLDERRDRARQQLAQKLLERAGPERGVLAPIPISEPVRYAFFRAGRKRSQVFNPDVVTGALPQTENWQSILIVVHRSRSQISEPSMVIDLEDPSLTGFTQRTGIIETEFVEVYRYER